jgi:hypothetical protein
MKPLVQAIEQLRSDVFVILEELRPVIESAARFQWNPSTMGFLPLIRRTMLCRQYECLECIVHLVQHQRGYAGIPLLRAACEELIWAKYLSLIDDDSANNLLLCLAQKEMFESLVAQDNYVGRKKTKQAGLVEPLDRLTKHQPTLRKRLKALARTLNWPAKCQEEGITPSMRWLAKKTAVDWVYEFLYHGTSRYVHFSPAELLKRAWGNPSEITIRSSNFGEYWSAFALFWGQKLLTQTFLELHESLKADGVIDPEIDGSKIIDAYQRMANLGEVPIITAAEIKWP